MNYYNELYLMHWGIKKQKWGVQHGPPYPLDAEDHSEAQQKANPRLMRKLERQDKRFLKKTGKKVYKKTYKSSKKEINEFIKRELNREIPKYNKDRSISAAYMNAYNRKLAEILNRNVEDVRSPSGQVIRFIAMRGQMGVFTALTSPDTNLSQYKSGIYGSGRKAYSKKRVSIVD